MERNVAQQLLFTKLLLQLSKRLDLNHSGICKVNSEVMFGCIIKRISTSGVIAVNINKQKPPFAKWSRDIYICLRRLSCPRSDHFYLECSSRETLNFEEQIMSKDKYPNIFMHHEEAIVFIILQILCSTSGFEYWEL